MKRSWIRNLFARSVTRPIRKAPRRARPVLEALEDRTLPSTLIVTSNLDTGVAGDGSLRGQIAAASSSDTINFDPSLAGQTITLTVQRDKEMLDLKVKLGRRED